MQIFNELDEALQRGLSDLKIEVATEIQAQMIPKAIAGANVLSQAETGSGKTLSYLLPILNQIDFQENNPSAVVIVPTRELADQVTGVAREVARYKKLKIVRLIGKQSFDQQTLLLNQKSHVIVGTPGRILDHIERGTFDAENIRSLVLDEVDELLNRGFIQQVRDIIDFFPEKRQTLMTSATTSAEVESFIDKIVPDYVRVIVAPKIDRNEKFKQLMVDANGKDKDELLLNILVEKNPLQAILFCREKKEVDRITELLRSRDISATSVQGDHDQAERFRAMEAFKRGDKRFLVATNLAARGIDVSQLPLIINVDFPETKDVYLHRMGRTGRMDNRGEVISFVEDRDQETLQAVRNEGIILSDMTDAIRPYRKEAWNIFGNTSSKRKEKVDTNVMTLYFNGGKDKKLRAFDFLGALTSIKDVTADDIGVITVDKRYTLVEILNNKGEHVLQQMKNIPVKKKRLKVHQDRGV